MYTIIITSMIALLVVAAGAGAAYSVASIIIDWYYKRSLWRYANCLKRLHREFIVFLRKQHRGELRERGNEYDPIRLQELAQEFLRQGLPYERPLRSLGWKTVFGWRVAERADL